MYPKNEAPYHCLLVSGQRCGLISLCFVRSSSVLSLLYQADCAAGILLVETAALSLLERFEQLSPCHVKLVSLSNSWPPESVIRLVRNVIYESTQIDR